MNILYTNFHSGPGIGGHTVYIQRLARALSSGHRITVATPATSSLYRLAGEIANVTVVAQDFPSRLSHVPAACRSLKAHLRAGKFDVVHVNGSSDHRLTLLAAGAKRPAVVFTKHNDLPVGFAGAWLRSGRTDQVIAVCDYVAHALRHTPYRRCGITTIRNGIDTEYFSPMSGTQPVELRRRWMGDNHQSKLLLGSNAGTDDYKGWLDLMRALALLPGSYRNRVHVAVAGDEPDVSAMQEVERLGLLGHLTYAGRLEDVRPMVAAFDIGFVLSWRVETISFACREMMSMGKPVIVTRHAGLPENIHDHRDGWVVPVREPQAIAKLLQRVLDGEVALDEMGNQARQKSLREFGLAPFVDATERVYELAAGRNRG